MVMEETKPFKAEDDDQQFQLPFNCLKRPRNQVSESEFEIESKDSSFMLKADIDIEYQQGFNTGAANQ